MITVTIRKNKAEEYELVQAIGHAGYASSGYDIVCSAVSVLFINTLNAIEVFTCDKDKMKIVTNEEEGLIDCRFENGLSKETVLLLDTLVLGLESISEQYSNKYFRLITEEV